MKPFPLATTFVVTDGAQAITPVPVTPDLYEHLDRAFGAFKGCNLIAEYAFDRDWATWEIHPAGDEFLYLLEGEAELRLLRDGQEESVRFHGPGSVFIVPRNTWHTAKVKDRCRMLFVTPGEGTRNEAEPPR